MNGTIQEEEGQDAPAQFSIQQQDPLRRLQESFIEVEEPLVRVEEPHQCELPKPGIRIQPLFVHAQQVRGAH